MVAAWGVAGAPVLDDFASGLKAYSVTTVAGEAVGTIVPPPRLIGQSHFLTKGVARRLVTVSGAGIVGSHDWIADVQAQVPGFFFFFLRLLFFPSSSFETPCTPLCTATRILYAFAMEKSPAPSAPRC